MSICGEDTPKWLIYRKCMVSISFCPHCIQYVLIHQHLVNWSQKWQIRNQVWNESKSKKHGKFLNLWWLMAQKCSQRVDTNKYYLHEGNILIVIWTAKTIPRKTLMHSFASIPASASQQQQKKKINVLNKLIEIQ